MTDPSPEFRDIAYQRYSASAPVDYARLVKTYSRMLDHRIQFQPQWSCLDIACGYGNFLAYLRAKGVQKYVGIDLTENAVARAIKEFGDTSVKRADALAFVENAKAPFDFISALDFVEHLRPDELNRLLAGVHGALRANGLFLIRTPNAGAPFGMAARYNDITHEQGFTVPALGDVFERAGFKVIGAWEDFGRPTDIKQFAHSCVWQAVRSLYRILDMAETGVRGSGIMTRNFWMLVQRPS